ncbi:hypothetical protein QMZ30_00285 [Pantoea sp. EA-12]|uniref:hypothetical protein n=1 Tax=Pantoea sp. EA-12 TaxID=3043303 RepID=UPI0024B48700|nr:hypothetical protein [Pantoea sp. EA-12]MDI9219330.1 hypothetical protein [Pantoea sp. EA-12]
MSPVNDIAPVSIRFLAVTGSKTQRGGVIVGTSDFIAEGKECVLEGDKVVYPDGSHSIVSRDATIGVTTTPDQNTELTIAATGTAIANGDVIVDPGQYRMATVLYSNGEGSVAILDEDEVAEFKSQGLIS